jgi:CheY-like chemotaxis protein
MNNKPCLLVADDDPGDVFLLRRAFRRAALECEIVEVHDGEQAVEYLSGTPPYDDRLRYPVPSLVLLDMKMPKMNGFDVLAWMGNRPYLDQLPVVMLSGSSLEGDAATALHLGAHDYLVKRADMTKMVEMAQGLHLRFLAPVCVLPKLCGTFSTKQKTDTAVSLAGLKS